jgi:hypothetical protein
LLLVNVPVVVSVLEVERVEVGAAAVETARASVRLERRSF